MEIGKVEVTARDLADAEKLLREANGGRAPFYSHIPIAARVMATVRVDTEERLLRAFQELADELRTSIHPPAMEYAADEVERVIAELRAEGR